MNSETGGLDGLFAAFADPTRRRILELLSARQPRATNQLAEMFPVTRWAVMKHLAALQDAGLVQTLPQGRRRLHFLDRRPLDLVDAWLSRLGSPG